MSVLSSLDTPQFEQRYPDPIGMRVSPGSGNRRFNRLRTETGMLTEYVRTVRRWWIVIVGCSLAGAVLSFSLTLHVLPLYQARTSLDIQSINSDFLNMKNVAQISDNGSSSSDSYVQTEIKLLQSRTVLDRTVAEMKAKPHPRAIDRNDMLSQWKRALHLSRGNDLPYAALVDDAAQRIKIKPMGVTRLVEITCSSWDAKFSAAFCNEITEQFRAIDLETRSTEAQKTSEFLTRQVADVRQKAEESEKKLEAATGGDGLALSQESNRIGEDHLRQLESEIVRAEANRIEKESALRVATSSSPDAIASLLDGQTYRDYEQKLAALNAKVSELMPPLTEQHPKIIHLQSEIRQLKEDMQKERAATLRRMQNDFDSARNYENRLNSAYAAAQTNVSEEMSKTERVNLLRREVDSETQLYQTLLQRAKEAGFASAMETTTMRVVDTAVVPKAPYSPRREVASIGGLFVGVILGVGFAFYRTRTCKVFLMPGDSEPVLRVPELGAIPTADFMRSRALYSFVRSRFANGATQYADEVAPAIVPWKTTTSLVTEAFRNVTHSILLAAPSPRRKSCVYTMASANSGEGKSTVTANLAIAFSKSKLRVVIVDADMRKPTQHKKFGIENKFGLRNILREEINVASAPLDAICKETIVPHLSLVPAGEGDESAVELLHSGAASALLKRLSTEFDLVLIDTPPMLHMADARILSAQADGVILVLRAGVTSREDAADACDRFENDNVKMVGTILNDFNASREGRGDYYSSYFQYMNDETVARSSAATV